MADETALFHRVKRQIAHGGQHIAGKGFRVFATVLIGHTPVMPLAVFQPAWMKRLKTRDRRARHGIWCAIAVTIMASAWPMRGTAQEPFEWRAGAYSFSNELGGFTIDGVSGRGTKDDPIVIRETFNSSSPITLVIRAKRPIRPFDSGDFYANGILYMRVLARNGSGQGWVEFEFELQEHLYKTSVFSDGLSFDQRTASKENISSDSFKQFSRDFEPGDRLRFNEGKVDPGKAAGFSFLITDYTPRAQFYLAQDPRIPST